MGCGCEGQKLTTPRKANVQFCDECDPCEANKSNVKLCAYVVPTLEEGRYYTNSFIFVEEDDSVYYISDDRSEIPFGSRPKYIDNFDPDDVANQFKSTIVFDLENGVGYVYGPDGERVSLALTDTPIVSIEEGDGIKITASDGEYTIAIREDKLANIDSIPDLTEKVGQNETDIKGLKPVVEGHTSKLTELEPKVKEAGDNATSALTLAGTADEEAKAAQAQATELASSKQNKLQAGDNISIENDIISATNTSYKPAADTNGLMTSTDRDTMKGGVVSKVEGQAAGDIFLVSVTTKKSNADGTEYTESVADFSIPTATATAAGMLSPTTYNQIATNTSDIASLKEIKYAKSLDLTMDESNYQITLKLNDQDGTALSTKTIDLPLESVVVGGKYDEATKEVVLTLKNGEEVKFSVADLVSGLQTEITPENKLSPDLIDLPSGEGYLTTEEKAKLDAINLTDTATPQNNRQYVSTINVGQTYSDYVGIEYTTRSIHKSDTASAKTRRIELAKDGHAGVVTAAEREKLDSLEAITEYTDEEWKGLGF